LEIGLRSIRIAGCSDKVTIYFLGDLHYGSGNYNETALKRTIEEIKETPNAYWIGMGDYGDHIYYTDHRYSPNSMAEAPDVQELREGIMGQIRKLAKILEPIQGQCLGILTGNHEEKIANKYHLDATRELGYCLKAPYLGYLSLIRLLVCTGTMKKSRYSLVIFAAHGTRAPRRSGGKINAVEDSHASYDADIYAIGHSHGLVTSKLELRGISTKGKETRRQRVYIVTSGYLDTSRPGTINYAEKAVYVQSPCRSPYVRFWFMVPRNELNLETTI